MWYEWFFDGIGTTLIGFLAGAVTGGVSGYKLAIKKNGLQTQKAKNKAVQKQELEIEYAKNSQNRNGIENNIQQSQKAGKEAKQSQVGKIKHG